MLTPNPMTKERLTDWARNLEIDAAEDFASDLAESARQCESDAAFLRRCAEMCDWPPFNTDPSYLDTGDGIAHATDLRAYLLEGVTP